MLNLKKSFSKKTKRTLHYQISRLIDPAKKSKEEHPWSKGGFQTFTDRQSQSEEKKQYIWTALLIFT